MISDWKTISVSRSAMAFYHLDTDVYCKHIDIGGIL